MSSQRLMFIIMLCVICAAQIASDIYAPSLPAISIALHTSVAKVQFSMAIYMFGLAISQLFYGSISEGLGRRKPLIAGLMILCVGNFVCWSAPSITVLIIGRLIQGCGAGACASLWRSIFRDKFEGVELAKYGSYLSIFVTFVVPVTPVLGGYLQEYFSWRASFAFLAIYSISTLILVFIGLKETSQHHHFDKLNIKFIFQTFRQMLMNPIFMGYTLCTFLCYGAFFSWFTTGPVLLIHILGLSPIEFGWITLFGGGVATAIAGWINGKLVSRLGTHKMMRAGFLLMLVAGSLMLIGNFIFGVNTFAIVIPMAIFYFGLTFIWPNAFAGAFAPYGKMAGYAGALYGFMQISGGAAIGTIASYLPHQNQLPLSFVFISTAIFAWLVFEKVVCKKPVL
jgi:Bcr/CflA subfamily drug resistance transporter